MAKADYIETVGKKINNSHVVFQVTKLIFDGVPDTQIARILQERYSFKVSTPSIAAFRSNYYEKRLAEMQQFSQDFQNKQTGRIQTFIDESLNQAQQIKADIAKYDRCIADLERDMEYVRKFETLFEAAIDGYVRNYDPNNPSPTHFLDNRQSPEQQLLQQAINNMGPAGRELLVSYISSRSTHILMNRISAFRKAALGQRESLVKIHKDIFKGYRNFSIMQELVTIFEKYNALIVEEFFPDRNTMDKAKYFRVRKRILALFDEFQIRYQGVESPSDKENDPSLEEAEAMAEKARKSKVKAEPEKLTVAISGPGAPPKESVENRRRAAEAQANTQTQPEVITPNGATDELQIIEHPPMDAEQQTKLDDMFSSVLDSGADIVADLDHRATVVQNQNVPVAEGQA